MRYWWKSARHLKAPQKEDYLHEKILKATLTSSSAFNLKLLHETFTWDHHFTVSFSW